MRRTTHRKSPSIRPQWAGTEEAQPISQAEVDAIMRPFLTGKRSFLDCEEEPPHVVRAKLR